MCRMRTGRLKSRRSDTCIRNILCAKIILRENKAVWVKTQRPRNPPMSGLTTQATR
ncbi:hypothetical protein HMPREF9123_1724 [Neisseria bacilliformis ATCC BAA-1200]|uniref:Uncharacterized protein n=1 Tax=Neisseria bacilliformis ATCC BAA-1200 TaxID=888742 RepID=F2BDB8_9NEIS|nr:hypothetical protein HMPREF9123_1724 [Neisseria bacilliformis ATCC BAA-1200]